MTNIVRSDADVALDEVTERCKIAADHYRTVARLTQRPELLSLFNALAQTHQSWVEQLEAQVRRQGNLPSAPDADREALEHLAVRIRAALGDERTSLLHESQRVEKALIDQAQAALAEELPPDARRLVKEICGESTRIRQLLITE